MKTLLSLFCLVTYLTCALSQWPVSLDMACNKALSGVACSFEFTNNANEDLYLLKRNTPLEGLRSRFVSVSLDGHPLEYEGIIMDPTYCSKTGESKEGTLLHEWSHPYGQRDDVVYGRSNCKNLANTRPDDAVRNADSYLYYYCDL
uniref:Lysine-specific metallo-endopeptidase domain-containing protein n=1 Tax=Amphimedon queenslandica TaxID=400682 RepID=A0A1X7UJM4_AMPQE